MSEPEILEFFQVAQIVPPAGFGIHDQSQFGGQSPSDPLFEKALVDVRVSILVDADFVVAIERSAVHTFAEEPDMRFDYAVFLFGLAAVGWIKNGSK